MSDLFPGQGDGQDREAALAVGWGEAQFRRLLERLPAGAYTCDPEGLITYFNPHAEALWGRAPALNDPVDRFCGSFRLYASDGTPIAHDRCWMALALKDEVGYNGHEIVVERPDGQRLTALAHANPVRDEDGRLLGAVNVLVDITERKRAEEVLRRSEEQLRALNRLLEGRVAARTEDLQRSNRELEQFAYVASHDLQEPLRMVSSFLQLLERRYEAELDDTAHEYIRFAVDGAQRMHGLIRDLLAYSRVSTHGARFEPVDLGAVAANVLADLRLMIEETGAVVDVDPLPIVTADPAQLHQLLLNLVANAIKFRKPGAAPRIEVRAEAAEEGGAWAVSVADDGIGMDMQYAERIFRVFQRLHARDEYTGTGIGLAICKRIVERHGGTIGVEAAPERGATFTFTLPGPAA